MTGRVEIPGPLHCLKAHTRPFYPFYREEGHGRLTALRRSYKDALTWPDVNYARPSVVLSIYRASRKRGAGPVLSLKVVRLWLRTAAR